MTKYICEKCSKEFKQKSLYEKHLQRKTPCKNIETRDNNEHTNAIIINNIDIENNNIVNNNEVFNSPLNPIIKWSGGKKRRD
jgi:uncharacterized Zn-finger protein